MNIFKGELSEKFDNGVFDSGEKCRDAAQQSLNFDRKKTKIVLRVTKQEAA